MYQLHQVLRRLSVGWTGTCSFRKRIGCWDRWLTAAQVEGHEPEERLMDWAKENGMENCGVRIAGSPLGGRGLFSTTDFIKGNTVLQLPMHLTMMVYPDDEENKIEISDDDLPDTVIRLAVKLLKTVKGRSELDVYAKCMPEHFPNPSIVFKSIAKDDIYREELLKVVKYYEETVSFLMGLKLENVMERDVRWALGVIQSRSFGNGMGQEMVVPFIDIMNHGDPITNELFEEHPEANVTYGWLTSSQNDNRPENWKMMIRARKTILDGEELFVSYGDHSNEFFLLYYGFVPLYNPRDEFVLFRNLDDILVWFYQRYPEERGTITDEQLTELKNQIRIEGQMSEVVKLNLCADGSVSPIMFEFFKFLCNGSEESASELISLVCLDRLQQSTLILDDLRALRDAAPEDTTFFEYQYETMKRVLKQSSRNSAPEAQETHSDDASSPYADRSVLYGSVKWWCLLHGVLKKKILWDFVLEQEQDVTSFA